MRIGAPKEIKVEEYRVGLTPASVREYVAHGHEVIVEHGAGLGIGAGDEAYRAAGAAIVDTAAEVFADRRHDREGQGAAAGANGASCAKARSSSPICILRRIRSRPRDFWLRGCTAIAYETVTDAHGGLPLLAPMSEVAGRLAIEAAAAALRKPGGGMGKLIGGVPGVAPARSPSSAAASSAPTRRAWPPGSAPISSSSTVRCRAFAPLTRCSPGRVRTRFATLEAIDEETDRRRRRHRRRAGAGRQRTETRLPRASRPHEEPRRAGRRRHRPGRLFRDVAADDPPGPDLSR